MDFAGTSPLYLTNKIAKNSDSDEKSLTKLFGNQAKNRVKTDRDFLEARNEIEVYPASLTKIKKTERISNEDIKLSPNAMQQTADPSDEQSLPSYSCLQYPNDD